MASLQREHKVQEPSGDPRPFVPPAVLIALLSSLLAGAAGSLLSVALASVVVPVVVLGGAYGVYRVLARTPDLGDSKAPALLSLLDRGGSPNAKPPAGFTGDWHSVYERVNRLAAQSQTGASALGQLDRFRKQADQAASLLREGKDPLTEIAELRVGPLHDLLDAVKAGSAAPVVSRLSLGEEELIGVDGDPLPPAWPKGSSEDSSAIAAMSDQVKGELHELFRGLTDLSVALRGSATGPAAEDGSARTPAQLVDAVVVTAADGIEDLAAGLMRANELTSVAERVTNRATLLALNAALEATRSGSEAFAAIAEETRRLAEFAREATDTISRLTSEIEIKVGETITAIHATSEDAKASLADMSGSMPATGPSLATIRSKVERLRARARDLSLRIDETSGGAAAEPSSDDLKAGSATPPETVVSLTPEETAPDAVEYHPVHPDRSHDIVENASSAADKITAEGIMLIEGLKPGARLES